MAKDYKFTGNPELDAMAALYDYTENPSGEAVTQEPALDDFIPPWATSADGDFGGEIDVSDPVQYFEPGTKVEGKLPEEAVLQELTESSKESKKEAPIKHRGDAIDSILGQYFDTALAETGDEEPSWDQVMESEVEDMTKKPVEASKKGKNVAKKVTVVEKKAADKKDVPKVEKKTEVAVADLTPKFTSDTGAVDETDTILGILLGVPMLLRSLGGRAAMSTIKAIVDRIGATKAAEVIPQMIEKGGAEAIPQLKRLGEMLPKGRGIPSSPIGRELLTKPIPPSPIGRELLTKPMPPVPRMPYLKSEYGKAARAGNSEKVKAVQKLMQKFLADQKAGVRP